jgi:tRNA(Ile)-lysidine synthase
MDVLPVFQRLEALAPAARTLLVAVSGGGDSVALLRLLGGGPYRLAVAHVDHALRPGSADAAAFVEALCEARGVPCHTIRLEVARIAGERGWNLEDAARRLRYDFLTRAAKRTDADAILTAHTRDDHAETVLMQLLRGAAHTTGIPARRGSVVRPLLGVSREQLRDYLEGLKQPFLEDETNTDTRRTRAWLRYEVLPLLALRYPDVREKLTRFAELQREQADVLQVQAQRLFRDGRLELARLRREPPALQRTAVAALLKDAGIAPDTFHLEQIRWHLTATEPTRLSLPNGKHVRLAYGRLEVVADVSQQPLPSALPADLDPAKLAAFPKLYRRTRAPGDRIRLAGGSKKVSDLLIDRKVPRELRDSLAVLATDPVGPSEVLWVKGVATDVRVARAQPDPDVRWMQQALAQAERAARAGEVPVGAVVVRGNELLAAAANTTRSDADPTAHAELKALREAARVLGDWRLEGCTLYVTLEPCPMCFGAVLSAHLPRVVYGAANRREGALGGVTDLREHSWKRTLVVRAGVLARDAERLLQDFFAQGLRV